MSRKNDSGPSSFDRALWALVALALALPFVLAFKLWDAVSGND